MQAFYQKIMAASFSRLFKKWAVAALCVAFLGGLEAAGIFHAGITRPSAAVLFSIGVTALLCGLLALRFWLLVAAWLYQAAELSDMSGSMWGVLGLGGNVFSAALFAILRSCFRKKCPTCGSWQDRKAAYCAACGGAMAWKCPDCSTDCSIHSHFCPACGVRLENAGAKGEEKC